jgi:protein PhnA
MDKMNVEKELGNRSGNSCELCSATEHLEVYEVQPLKEGLGGKAFVCLNCRTQLDQADEMVANHWHCLNDSMWSEVPAVKVLAWRMLHRLQQEAWAQSLLDMMYLDEETEAWAKDLPEFSGEEIIEHLDSNGVVLTAGDTVVLIKDLNVRGANFTAKRGTAVRRISLVHDNPEHIEGKVNGQQIVILTKYVKKAK